MGKPKFLHLITVLLIFSILFGDVTAQKPTRKPKQCKPGQFKEGNSCTNCPPNTFSAVFNAKACKPCPPRRFSKQRARARQACRFCQPGLFYNATSNRCQECPFNTFNGKKDARECTPCPPGKTSAMRRQRKSECFSCPIGLVVTRSTRRRFEVTCEKCPAGKSTFKLSAEVCQDCPKGTFRAAERHTATCQPCRPGTFSEDVGRKTTCNRCPLGFFQNERGQTRCKKCPPGSSTLQGGSSTCTPNCKPNEAGCEVKSCRPGFGLNSETMKCEACPPGTVNPRLSTTPCVICQMGDGTVNSARTTCICQDGFELLQNGTCRKCRSGFSTSDSKRCMCILMGRATDYCTCPPLSRRENDRCVPCDPAIDVEVECN